MTAKIMQKKKQVGPCSYNIKFDSRYHGSKVQLVAPSEEPQLMMYEH